MLCVFDFSGELRKRIRLSIEAERVTRRERRDIKNDFRDRVLVRIRDRGGAIDDPRIDWNSIIAFRDPKAYWRAVDVDPQGFIWLEYPRALSDTLSASHRLLSPVGEYLGDLRVPHPDGRFRYGEYLVLVKDQGTDELIPTVFQMMPTIAELGYPNE